MMVITQKRIWLYGIPAILLSLPFFAMQFTTEVQWTSSDFVIGGILLFGTAFIIDVLLRVLKSKKQRLIAVVTVVLTLMIVWAELAVGLFGSPWAGS